MYYLFADEKYLDVNGRRRIITGNILVSQGRWNQMEASRRRVVIPLALPRLARIEDLLGRVRGIGVIAYADLDLALIPTGARDSTDDIPDMARADNAWGICLLFGIAAAISFLCKDGYTPRTVDVFYDARSIKIAQEQALRETFQRECSWIMRDVVRRGLVKYRSVPHLRRFTPVPKPPDNAEPDKFQDGTQVSHYLCQQSRELISHPNRSQIYVWNATERVKSALSKFRLCQP
jgi:hypothetical protein